MIDTQGGDKGTWGDKGETKGRFCCVINEEEQEMETSPVFVIYFE